MLLHGRYAPARPPSATPPANPLIHLHTRRPQTLALLLLDTAGAFKPSADAASKAAALRQKVSEARTAAADGDPHEARRRADQERRAARLQEERVGGARARGGAREGVEGPPGPGLRRRRALLGRGSPGPGRSTTLVRTQALRAGRLPTGGARSTPTHARRCAPALRSCPTPHPSAA